jgi:hypothetical protein
MIGIINALAHAINFISDPLGLFHINDISEVHFGGGGGGGTGGGPVRRFAMGGIPERALGGPGFVTNVPVALVGEGRSSYDEFVIPTDPQYRDRALALYASLGSRLMDVGGVVGGIGSALGDLVGGGVGAVGGAAGAIKDFWDAINDVVSDIGGTSWSYGKDAANSLKDKAVDWAEGKFGDLVNNLLGGSIGGLFSPAPADLSANQSLVKGFAQIWHGWFGDEWTALYHLIMGESGFNNTAQNPTSTAYGMFQFLDTTWGTVGGHKTSDPLLQTKYGLDYIAQRYGDPMRAYGQWLNRSPHWYEMGGIVPGLMNGGIVLPRPGGTLVRLGEGSGAEMVQPLRHDGTYGESTVNNFYGDLSFPNITKPSDAKKFLTNLENVGTR